MESAHYPSFTYEITGGSVKIKVKDLVDKGEKYENKIILSCYYHPEAQKSYSSDYKSSGQWLEGEEEIR